MVKKTHPFLGHQGPASRDIPDPTLDVPDKNFICKAPFSVVLDKECLRQGIGVRVKGVTGSDAIVAQ